MAFRTVKYCEMCVAVLPSGVGWQSTRCLGLLVCAVFCWCIPVNACMVVGGTCCMDDDMYVWLDIIRSYRFTIIVEFIINGFT